MAKRAVQAKLVFTNLCDFRVTRIRILLLREGSDGREARLGPGDFTLCDTSRPYEMQFDTANRMFVVGIPDTLLRRHLASPESVLPARM